MEDLREYLVLFGGLKKANKKDKTTGLRLAETYCQFNVIEIDEEQNMVNTKPFFIDDDLYEKICSLNLKLLNPCYVYIKSSATSNFSKLIDVKKYVEKKNS